MRYLKYLVVLIFVFTSCKTKKYALVKSKIAKEMSAKKVAKKHISANFNQESLTAKFKVNFNDGITKQSISVQLKIKKDEVIWLKGTKVINIFKAKITPKKVRFYSSLERKYFEGDFSMIEKLLGIEVNFQQLQNLFLGQALLNIKKEKHHVAIVKNAYLLTPQVQTNLFNAFFAVNPWHFKLDEQTILNTIKKQRLDVKYPSYKLVGNEIFPQEIKIKVKQNTKLTTIDFILKSMVLNTEINTSFRIPNGYKRMNP